jgi:hypothetical protein
MLLEIRTGDPDDEVMGAWLAKESVREIYLTDGYTQADLLLDRAIEGSRLDAVEEVRKLGRTLKRWRTEILNHHVTGASNSPTGGLNLLIKKVKRAGHGFRNFANYRLRILLHASGIRWVEHRPPPPRIRTRRSGPLPTQPEGPPIVVVANWKWNRLEGRSSCLPKAVLGDVVEGKSEAVGHSGEIPRWSPSSSSTQLARRAGGRPSRNQFNTLLTADPA